MDKINNLLENLHIHTQPEIDIFIKVYESDLLYMYKSVIHNFYNQYEITINLNSDFYRNLTCYHIYYLYCIIKYIERDGTMRFCPEYVINYVKTFRDYDFITDIQLLISCN